MKRKIIGILVCTLLITTILPITVSSDYSSNNIIYVDDDGTADYTRIENAIYSASDGDTIIVMPGVYYESVIIYKSIKIIGQDKNTTIIDGKKETVINSDRGLVHITKDYVTFGNFTVRNASKFDAAVYAMSEYTTISDNILLNEDADVIGAPSGILVLSDRSLINWSDLWWSDSYKKGHNNICRNLLVGNFYFGVLTYGSENIIEGNVLMLSFSQQGIQIGFQNNIVENNIVSGSCYGIFLYCSINTKVNGNFLAENDIGIIIMHGYFNTISNNHVANNENGIELWASSNNKIIENNFIDNGKNTLIDRDIGLLPVRILALALLVMNGINPIGKNTWDRNYYDDQTTVPYKIPSVFIIFPGEPEIVFTYYLNFDWHPAKEPYDIPIVEEKL